LKSFTVFAILILSLLLLYLVLAETGNVTWNLDSGEKKEARGFLNADKLYLPPEASAYVKKKYPGGLIPLPLDRQDWEFVSHYLKGSGYIIELNEKPVSLYRKEAGGKKSLKEYEESIRSSHESILSKLASNPETRVRREFFNVFNGVSIENAGEAEIQEIASSDLVKRIYPVKEYHMLLSESVPMIGATDAWGVRDSLDRNITGQNVTIAIIDTGIDYTHPDLGNCSQGAVSGNSLAYNLSSEHPYNDSKTYNWTIKMPGYKSIAVHFSKIDVEYGFDFLRIKNSANHTVKTFSGLYEDVWSPSVAGDTVVITLYTDYGVNGWGFEIDATLNGSSARGVANCSKVIGGYNFLSEDIDIMDDQGHGTHCAAIAAGNGTLKGVAPDARILAYKVVNAAGSAEEDDIIVISMSLGYPGGSPDDALSKAVDSAVDSGVVVVVAAGNEGPYNETISSPGCARKAITVGATYKANDSGRNRMSSLSIMNVNAWENISSLAMTYSALTPTGGTTGTLIDAGIGLAQDFAGKDYSGKIALIRRGNLTFKSKVANAHNAGAVAAIIYNNYYGNFKGDLANLSSIPAVSISESDGQRLLDMMKNGSVSANVSVALDSNVIADFSSRGPAYIYNKPDILAPGVSICAAKWGEAYPENPCLDDSHVSLSGTSMATPHVAGAAALLLQKNPSWTPLQIKAALKNTAKSLGQSKNIQGAGEIDVYAAINLTNPPLVAMITDIDGVDYHEK